MKKIFLFFHLNLAFSSIPIKDRKIVIKKCYWRILEIIDNYKIPISIEMSAYTLSEINRIDRNWVKEFIRLKKKNLTTLIGSGYCQIIFPLCPEKINKYNLEYGNTIYKNILGFRSKIYYVNEQCYSKSIVDILKKNGFNTLIMEWENPFEFNDKLKINDKFFNHKVIGNKYKLNLVWNSSVNFQKFQRYTYGKETENDYLNHIKKNNKNFYCLYGSDAEVFNYRPKRNFVDEKHKIDEWERIANLFKNLKNKYNFILVDRLINEKKFYKKINVDISASIMPCPTKKQGKYNINRWSLSSHRNYILNSKCFEIYNHLIRNKVSNTNTWKKLIYLFSSDFRTHIHKSREVSLLTEINKFQKKLKMKKINLKKSKMIKKFNINIINNNENLIISDNKMSVSFNLKRFLSINNFYDFSVSDKSLISTIKQGFYKRNFNYDLYSAHMISETHDNKYTDISYVSDPVIKKSKNIVYLSDKIKNKNFSYKKNIEINFQKKELCIMSSILFYLKTPTSIRMPIFTINPNLFDKKQLYYSSSNGINNMEYFKINKNFNFGKRISNTVTSKTSIGFNTGRLIIGDEKKCLEITNDHQYGYSLPLIEFKNTKKKYMLRISMSCRENDDTSKHDINKKFKNKVKIKFYNQNN